ncbi:VaFE repeat-containing surface-anchored protein [Paracoccus salsus]|uniref:VaFE repeat-containing surface-anchored protein n=1 Tax=Paracoccus salsus TaxID=2911061 RepID=UPI001F284A09|nr:VaFE repeat-containing surface-anchored protein [Paracoccus salsus]MCF3975064.1 VaFE repeat-containing surface-anchored protein [Paracoccus salsus]
MDKLFPRGGVLTLALVLAGMAQAETATGEASLSAVLVDALDDNRFFTRTGGTARDDVAYRGLTAGQAYTIAAQLVEAASGKPVGDPVFVGFTADAAEGAIAVSIPVAANRTRYNIDYSSHLTLYEGEVDEGSAASANVLARLAEDRTDDRVIQVHAVQRVSVSAADAADGDRALPAEGGTIVATVDYENLVEGYHYTLWGELLKTSGQSTGIFSAIPDYVPETKNGTVDMSFEVPEGLDGLQLVPSIGLYHQSRVELQPNGMLTILPDAPNPVMIASDPNLDIDEKRVDIGTLFQMDDAE